LWILLGFDCVSFAQKSEFAKENGDFPSFPHGQKFDIYAAREVSYEKK